MKEELENKLYKAYPKIFPQKGMGIACGSGWYALLDALCVSIQGYTDGRKNIGKEVAQVEAVQVKEKFGGLRFYYHGGDKCIEGMVWLAEAMAPRICEWCGTTVGVKTSGKRWLRSLCEKCAK